LQQRRRKLEFELNNKNPPKAQGRSLLLGANLDSTLRNVPTRGRRVGALEQTRRGIQAHIDRKKVSVFTRNGYDWTEEFPVLVEALKEPPVKSAVFGGEAVAIEPGGKPDFQAMRGFVGTRIKCIHSTLSTCCGSVEAFAPKEADGQERGLRAVLDGATGVLSDASHLYFELPMTRATPFWP
jgi:hypothetical protein